MIRAQEELFVATAKYREALEIAKDTEWNADGIRGLRYEGRVYAQAVTSYTTAVMNWLVFVESQKFDR